MTSLLKRACVAISVNEVREKGFGEEICRAMELSPEAVDASVKAYASTVRAVLMAVRQPEADLQIDAWLWASDESYSDFQRASDFTAMIDTILKEESL